MPDSPEPKKETVRITLPPRPGGPTAAPNAPGRETVRINMPVRPPSNGAPAPPRPGPMRPPGAAGGAARPPMAHAPLPPAPSKAVTPPPLFKGKPVTSGSPATPAPAPLVPKAPSAPPAAPVPQNRPLSTPGPKKETARITVLPDPPAKPLGAIQMKKTQPLSTMPEPAAPISPIKVAAAPIPAHVVVDTSADDGIPMALCWGLFGVSAIVLVVQIWNYFA
jgi:hypothetical protein